MHVLDKLEEILALRGYDEDVVQKRCKALEVSKQTENRVRKRTG